MKTQIISLILTVFMSISSCLAGGVDSCAPLAVKAVEGANIAVSSVQTSELQKVADGIIRWKKQQNGGSRYLLDGALLANAGSTSSDWYAFAIGRLEKADRQAAYLEQLKNYVEKCYQSGNGLSRQKATEWHRIALAVIACGGDPTAFGIDANGKTINLIADGTYDRGKTASLGKQGLNGYIWALITVDAKQYTIPAGSHDTREDMIRAILAGQVESGGFALSGNVPDVDVTAMAIQALAPYYNNKTVYTVTLNSNKAQVTRTVKETVEMAFNWLSGQQNAAGSFLSYGVANPESICQVIVALCSMGIDPEKDSRFVKEGNTLWDALLKFRQKDGGFAQTVDANGNGQSNSMASEQVLYTVAAWMRLKQGKNRLYDCRDMKPVEPTPTSVPTKAPTNMPTSGPTQEPTKSPTQPTGKPTNEPAQPTGTPSAVPTGEVTGIPTVEPTKAVEPTGTVSVSPELTPGDEQITPDVGEVTPGGGESVPGDNDVTPGIQEPTPTEGTSGGTTNVEPTMVPDSGSVAEKAQGENKTSFPINTMLRGVLVVLLVVVAITLWLRHRKPHKDEED